MEKYYIAAITAVDNIGYRRIKILLEFFGTAKKIWTAERGDLEKAKLPVNVLEAFLLFRQQNPSAPEKLVEFCEAKKIGLSSIVDEDYPPLLKEIALPPAVIYYRGKLEPSAERIAMVGTREYTPYGKRVALELGEDLAAAGITVVSGAARGIDTFSHQGAMKSGRTVAVIGSGILYKNSAEKQRFLDEIVESGGVVLTEFKPSMHPNAGNFPARNRIIAGLSRGVIVVEAGEKSGALITTDFAGDFGRDVFAVPGSIYSPKSKGCIDLIRDGATLITDAQDILDFYTLASGKISNSQPLVLDEKQEKVLNLIPFAEAVAVDEILMQADDIEPNEISEILLQLETKDAIQEVDGNYTRLK